MKQLRDLGIARVPLLVMAFVVLATGSQTKAQPSDIEQINTVSQAFVEAITERDINLMEKLWARDPRATFIGPLSTTVVVGWDEVRKAWTMRFGQFDRVMIAPAQSHVRTHGDVAWVVGMENVKLLRKTGETLSFDAFVTNVFEKQAGRWLMISHHATPVFREAR
jgi:ketosteroid isomerase-like protein